MAIPPDTPMPCIVKDTVAEAAGRSIEGGRVAPATVIATSLALAELVGEELLDGVDRRDLVDAVDAPGHEPLRRDVRRSRAVDVGEHEYALPLVEEANEVLGHRQDLVRVVMDRDADLPQEERPFAEHVARRMDQRFAERAVGHDEDADHGG